jgi:hypothetical protein
MVDCPKPATVPSSDGRTSIPCFIKGDLINIKIVRRVSTINDTDTTTRHYGWDGSFDLSGVVANFIDETRLVQLLNYALHPSKASAIPDLMLPANTTGDDPERKSRDIYP